MGYYIEQVAEDNLHKLPRPCSQELVSAAFLTRSIPPQRFDSTVQARAVRASPRYHMKMVLCHHLVPHHRVSAGNLRQARFAQPSVHPDLRQRTEKVSFLSACRVSFQPAGWVSFQPRIRVSFLPAGGVSFQLVGFQPAGRMSFHPARAFLLGHRPAAGRQPAAERQKGIQRIQNSTPRGDSLGSRG